MFNIDLGIQAGNESLIKEQLNDPICGEIGNIYDKVSKIAKLYYDKRSITKKDFDHEFNIITKEFSKLTYDRFGIHITLRNSNTFAIIPIFNPDQIDVGSFKSMRSDIKHGMKQIKDFNKWLDNNSLILDKENAKFINLPIGYYVPLFISPKSLKIINKDEFTAIILHEIGHAFTLMEMYSKTTETTSILLTNFLRNKTVTETTKDLKITKKPKNEKDGLQLIFESVEKNIRTIALGGTNTGQTDSEWEADNFAAKFGYGEALTSVLIKMNAIDSLTFSNTGAIIILLSMARIALSALLISLIVPGGIAIMIAIGIEFTLTIKRLTELLTMHGTRNPINDEHGSMLQRIDNIKTSVIEVIRKSDISKKETKLLLKQYDNIIENMTKLENSAHGKVLIGLMSDYFLI
jgi:hypothetical protein